MRFSTLFFLLLLIFLCLTVTQGSYEDCCLKYVKKLKTHKKMVVSYRKQETDGGCNIPAIVLTLKKGRQVCADPQQPWVQTLMKSLDSRLYKSKKHSSSHKKNH
ncbi:C-C motif chemokine 20-like [Arapaima gigas]